jgi:ATP-dependent DNA helicase RecG
MTLDSPIKEIKGVGAEVAKKLAILNVKTVGEMISYYPRRYDDYSEVQEISHIKPGAVTVRATIKQIIGRYASRGLHITEAVASDNTGSVRLIWFNQPYRAASLKVSEQYYISGEFALKRQRFSIQNPSIELVSDFPINTARIVPVYRETKGLKSAQIRRLLRTLVPVIKQIPETLPAWLIKEEGLASRSMAIANLHFPSNAQALARAKRRLGFEEIFELILAALLNKYDALKEEALSVPFSEELAKDFVSHLPFTLTDAQRKVIWQIYKDLQKHTPMNRLVEGDVGSGKTVLAAMAALMAVEQGYQAALMAPTELLARQHADTLFKLFDPLGKGKYVGLLVGSLTAEQKALAHRRIASGDIRLMVGTQALIQEKVDMHKLALIIIDEQHRFGVDQRKKLQAKAGHMPHVLSMTATPIPRSLALTLYGELDISIIDTMPANRKAITTKIVPSVSRIRVYKEIDKELEAGRQGFIVCPLIVESEHMPGRPAEQVYEELSKGYFKHRRVGLLHGKLKPNEKDVVMQDFVQHKYDLLVATTVIEVGVDVPNATVMFVENADRFGLAQLHQLRGRVGRSNHQGFCYLMLSDSQTATPRLHALQNTSDGFQLAEYDLALRGPGAIYGTLQHGQLDMRVAKLTDTKLIASARKRAQEFIDKQENLLDYKQLYEHVRLNRVINVLN